MRRRLIRFVTLAPAVLAVFAFAACETASTTSLAKEAASMAGKSLWDQLGGLSKVNSLADAFGTNLSKTPSVTKFLDASGIDKVKQGLVNEVAKASGVPAPNPGVDMLGALSGKGIDAQGVAGITDSLASAADTMKLSAPEKVSLMALVQPITQKLLAM